MGKTIKKAFRILAVFLLLVIMVPIIAAGLLLLEPVQNKVVDWATAYIESEYGVAISIGTIYIEPISTFSINEVLVYELNRTDTLLYVDHFEASLTRFRSRPLSLTFDDIALENGFVNLKIDAGDSVLNLQHVLNVIPKSNDTSTVTPIILADDIRLDDFRFRYDDFNEEYKEDPRHIDFSHLGITSISGRIKNTWWQKDSVRANVCGISLNEKSGFKLQDLQSELAIGTGRIIFSELIVQTNTGIVQGAYSMRADQWSDYGDFIHSVELNADLYDSKIRFNDLAYFTPVLRDLLVPFEFSGKVNGTIDDLDAKIEQLSFGHKSSMNGRVKVKGLPDIENTFIDADLDDLYASVEDVEEVNFPQDGAYKPLALPETVHRLGYVGFQGRFTGFIDDFVTYGNIETSLGYLDVDINVKTKDGFHYSGDIATSHFQMGKLFDAEPALKDIAMHLNVDGSGLDLKSLSVEAKGKVHHIDVNGYDYKKVDVDGVFKLMRFTGFVAVEDTNIDLRFKGVVDLNDKIPHILSHIDIDMIHLANLNLLPSDTFGFGSGEIDIELNGNTKKSLNGSLHLKNAKYSNREQTIELKDLKLTDRLIKSGHDIELISEIAQVKVIGQTSLFDLPFGLTSVANHYLPSVVEVLGAEDADTLQDFHFDARITNDPDLWAMVSPDLKFKNDIFVQGKLETRGRFFSLSADTLNWEYSGIEIDDQSIEIYPANDDLIVKSSARNLQLAPEYALENFETFAAVRKDSVIGGIDWMNDGDVTDSGSIELTLFRSAKYPLNALIQNLAVRVADVEWSSRQMAMISADSNHVVIEDVFLESKEGRFEVDGTLNRDKPSILNFEIVQFNLAYLTNFGIITQDIEGMFGGDVDVYYRNTSLIVDGSLTIDTLKVDGTEIGEVQGTARYSDELKKVILNANLKRDGVDNVIVMGDYFPTRKEDQFDIEVAFTHFNAESIEPFIDQFASELEGQVDGVASITGTIAQPDINGLLTLNSLAAKVNYLNTRYFIEEGSVKLYPDLFAMDVASVKDEKGATATTTVQVFHDYFKDWNYDVFLEAEDFLCLNTTIAQNDAYYGVANITGDINIGGYAAHNSIDVEASTDPETKLFIPLSSGGDVSEFDYIRFVSNDGFSITHNETALEQELKGLELNFRLAVDNDAEIQIIFDEKVGDIIKARGSGDMLMQIDNRGKFNMYGDYVISKGEYLFTLQNVINKRFKVVPGSRITWNGDVTEANLDLAAIYSLKASPAVMVAAMTGVEAENVDDLYKQRLPVDVNLLMQGPMSTPTIDFGVSLPSLPETDRANQLISPSVASQEQITSQAFSLLLANHFSPGNGNISLGGAGQSSGFEVLSNQLSNWASQYSDKFDVGVNYRDSYSDDAGATGSQTEVSLSTDLFDDRVSVSVNGTVQGSGNEDESGNVAGEFNVEYKINKDGSLRARVYNESNYNSAATLNQSPYTQGIGIFYQREFDTWGQFFRQTFGGKKGK